MLTSPEISNETIMTCLRDHFGLPVHEVRFLPIGADVNAAVYRVNAEDGSPYFLKLKRGDFDESGVAVPFFLHKQGIRAVMAPIKSISNHLWVREHGFSWVLYPFIDGQNGYRVELTDSQWITLGRNVKKVHHTVLPPTLKRDVPNEQFSSLWREVVKKYDSQVPARSYLDPVASRLAKFWLSKRSEIQAMVKRADELGRALVQKNLDFVLCHADLHPGNILLGAQGELAIVDWDSPIYAPKERDLMCIGGGLGFRGEDAEKEALFYKGYGLAQINTTALAYYRYERIIADIAAYGMQIFGEEGSKEDREEGLEQLMSQFQPNDVVSTAHRTYRNY